MSRKIDHIVYCVPNLEIAIRDLETKLGVKANIGGQHTTQGTKNALIKIGSACYLEILAIDETNKHIAPPRWMGIDLLESAKVTRWALKSTSINADSKILSRYNPRMGKVIGGSRKMPNGNTLSWQIAMPLSEPEVEIVPFITDWSESETHPTDSLNHDCELMELRLTHPKPNGIIGLFERMNIDINISTAEKASIGITIKSPKGIIRL